MQKRELFGSLVSNLKERMKQDEPAHKYLRPPYFYDESLFHKECNKCDAKCAAVCEEEIIKIADDKTPYIVFSSSGCTYCDKCALACEFGVLGIEHKKNLNAVVSINEQKCLSWNHTMCFSCKDPCLDNAIDFYAMFMAKINPNCTACGFCISRCPVDAIEVKVVS